LEKSEPTLEEVRRLFEEWRQGKKRRERIPETLWKAASSLSKQFSAHQISKLLHLNHTAVRDHIKAQNQDGGRVEEAKEAAFVELDVMPVVTTAGECVIEIEKKNGARLKLGFKCGGSDMINLAKTLWGAA
jgi:hypothetical protein